MLQSKSGCILNSVSEKNLNQYFTSCFKCGGIFNGHFTANLLLILAVQKF